MLAQAWRTASRVRNAVMLVRGRPGDSLPRDARELAAVAQHPRLPAGRSPSDLVDDYRRVDPAGPGGRGAGVLGLTDGSEMTRRTIQTGRPVPITVGPPRSWRSCWLQVAAT